MRGNKINIQHRTRFRGSDSSQQFFFLVRIIGWDGFAHLEFTVLFLPLVQMRESLFLIAQKKRRKKSAPRSFALIRCRKPQSGSRQSGSRPRCRSIAIPGDCPRLELAPTGRMKGIFYPSSYQSGQIPFCGFLFLPVPPAGIAMEGNASFVSAGRAVETVPKSGTGRNRNQSRNRGRHSFGYFSVAVDRKVTRGRHHRKKRSAAMSRPRNRVRR